MNRVKTCNTMDEKNSKKKGRGSMEVRETQDNIIVRMFKNKAVNLLSSFVGIKPVRNVKH